MIIPSCWCILETFVVGVDSLFVSGFFFYNWFAVCASFPALVLEGQLRVEVALVKMPQPYKKKKPSDAPARSLSLSFSQVRIILKKFHKCLMASKSARIKQPWNTSAKSESAGIIKSAILPPLLLFREPRGLMKFSNLERRIYGSIARGCGDQSASFSLSSIRMAGSAL